jgi:tryptophanyl-tRNA synthetase
MSSSKPKTAIFLSDSPETAVKKIKTAKTGGRESLDEQRELGGVPEECVVYEMLLYHLTPDDKELHDIYTECKKGEILCGECKNLAATKIRNFFESIQENRIEAKDQAMSVLENREQY